MGETMNALKRYTIRRFSIAFLLAAASAALLASGPSMVEGSSDKAGPLSERADRSGYGRGFIEPPFEPPDLNVRVPLAALSLPDRFDWREQGVVTSIKQQSSCGACFCFAALAGFESELLISGEGLFDFSENNVKECEWLNRNGFYYSGCNGGTFWMVVNYLTEKGTVLET